MLTAESSNSPANARRLSVSISTSSWRNSYWPGVDFAVGQCVKHERIVRIGAVADADELLFHRLRGGNGQFASPRNVCAFTRSGKL